MRLPFKLSCLLMLVASAPAFCTTFEREAKETICTNPLMYSERANQEATAQALNQAMGALFPQITLFWSGGRETTVSPTVRAFKIDRITLNPEQFNVGLTQLLFDGGKTIYEVKSRTLLNESAQFDVKKTRDVLILQTAEAYLNVMRNREIVKISEMNLRAHQETLDKVNMIFKGGAGRRSEVALAEARYSRAKAELYSAQGELEAQEATYATIVGHYPPAQMTMPDLPLKWVPKSLKDSTVFAVENNPELKAARINTMAQGAEVKSKRGQFLPTVNFNLQASEDDNLTGLAGRYRNVIASFSLQYNVFQGGSDLAAMRAARADQERSIGEAQQVYRKVIESLRLAWINIKTSEKQITQLTESVRANTLVVSDYKIQFNLGQRPLFNVLDAQGDLYLAEIALTHSRYNLMISYYRTLQSLGNIALAVLDIP